MSSDPPPNPTGRRDAPGSRRERWWLLALFLVLGLAIGFGRPLQRHLAAALASQFDAPKDRLPTAGREPARTPTETLTQIWQEGKFTGRLFVLNYLQTHVRAEPGLARELEAVLWEAAYEADLEAREAAFGILARVEHPGLGDVLREQLRDLDPAVRILALQHLAPLASSNDVAQAIHLLNDPDPRVILAAAALLRRAIGEDFGLEPRLAATGTGMPPLDAEAIGAGVARARVWWQQHVADYPSTPAVERSHHACPPRPARNFALRDVQGREVQLLDFRGKAVLLSFWALTNNNTLADQAMLQRLQAQHAQQLTVLAVTSDPGVIAPDGCLDHSADHARHPTPDDPPDPAKIQAEVRTLVSRLDVRFPVLLDPQGILIQRFNLYESPTYLLIDPQGNLCRRIVGARTESVFSAMIAEACANRRQAAKL